MKPLTVYKASAGSGKTFTLATEYIKLIVSNPMNYRNILAVTFTNKATEEMKMRILSQLYGIWKRLPDSSSYYKKVKDELCLPDGVISKNAGIALHYLIHNYNYFRVETIDTFFQSVLRNLARELDLTANLRISLNDKQVEQQAVDELIESLDSKNVMLAWIMEYIKENIKDDKSWNVIGEIKDFGVNIFKDFYKNNSKVLNERLEQKGFFGSYVSKIKKIKDDAKREFDEFSDTFFRILDENGLTENDFSNGKSGVCGYFFKLKKGIYNSDELLKGRVLRAIDAPENWVKKSEAKVGNVAYDLVCSCLHRMLCDFEEKRPLLLYQFNSANLTLRNLNQLRLLNGIDKKVREINEDTNCFLLSDTQTILGLLVQDSDSPFIFEKIGTQLNHIMIDEFQDTSTVQWKNFKVLLEETMSRPNEETHFDIGDGQAKSPSFINNMLVGDVKQSIYRWRSGDWRLLNDINKEFSSQQLEIENLDTNYRSNSNIIAFNNVFFRKAADFEYEEQKKVYPEGAEQLRNAYLDVEQKVPAGKSAEGEVKIELLSKEDYKEEMLNTTVETVEYLMENGIPEKKIAILVRSNKTIQDIADYFMENKPDVKLVSDEAFRLDASIAVNIIIYALQNLANENDSLALANLVKAYQRNIVNPDSTDSLLFNDLESINEFLPKEYVEKFNELKTMPIYDLTENLYRIFGLEKLSGQNAYVCAFFDKTSSFLEDNPTDINGFLKEWEASIHEKPIHGDDIDGIRLITIHKSKGLEFDNVIMPFCDWKLENASTIWCSPQEEPFNELPLIPVEFNEKKMKDSIYASHYTHEHLQNIVDNLNLLYVAFTRAGKNLYIFGKSSAKGTRSSMIEDIIPLVGEELGSDVDVCDEDNTGKALSFQFGTLSVPHEEKKEDKQTYNVFLKPSESKTIDIESFKNHVEFRQSNKSRDFINGEDDDDEQQSYITTGNILHSIFSSIRTIADVETALKELEFEGVLYDKDITHENLLALLRDRFTNPQVRDWFSSKWTVFNECTILKYNTSTDMVEEHRPDRVITDGSETIVIDYKFGRPRKKYIEQVQQYMDLLKDMGHTGVKGYLWFVYNNKIEEVK